MSRETQRKGDIAVAQAIALFTSVGWDVSIPLTESAAYDLIVDTGFGLKRVQVKFTSVKEVGLRRVHSNSQGYVVKKIATNSYDWLLAVWSRPGGMECHLFTECFIGRNSVNLSEKTKIKEGWVSGLNQ